jgi:hypothetical protein
MKKDFKVTLDTAQALGFRTLGLFNSCVQEKNLTLPVNQTYLKHFLQTVEALYEIFAKNGVDPEKYEPCDKTLNPLAFLKRMKASRPITEQHDLLVTEHQEDNLNQPNPNYRPGPAVVFSPCKSQIPAPAPVLPLALPKSFKKEIIDVESFCSSDSNIKSDASNKRRKTASVDLSIEPETLQDENLKLKSIIVELEREKAELNESLKKKDDLIKKKDDLISKIVRERDDLIMKMKEKRDALLSTVHDLRKLNAALKSKLKTEISSMIDKI